MLGKSYYWTGLDWTGPLLTIVFHPQTSRSFPASSVSAEPEAVQDEETRAPGLPGRLGQLGGRPAGLGAAGSDQSQPQSCRQRGIQLLQGEETGEKYFYLSFSSLQSQ